MIESFQYGAPYFLTVIAIGLSLGFWCCWRSRNTVSVFLTLFIVVLGIASYNALMTKAGSGGNPVILLAIIGMVAVPISVGWIVGAPLGWFVRWRRERQ